MLAKEEHECLNDMKVSYGEKKPNLLDELILAVPIQRKKISRIVLRSFPYFSK